MSQKKWWKSKAYDEVVDPISLDPISSLRKEPFTLHTTYFDAEILARYVILRRKKKSLIDLMKKLLGFYRFVFSPHNKTSNNKRRLFKIE